MRSTTRLGPQSNSLTHRAASRLPITRLTRLRPTHSLSISIDRAGTGSAALELHRKRRRREQQVQTRTPTGTDPTSLGRRALAADCEGGKDQEDSLEIVRKLIEQQTGCIALLPSHGLPHAVRLPSKDRSLSVICCGLFLPRSNLPHYGPPGSWLQRSLNLRHAAPVYS